jgi:hypothetical protein
MLRLWCRGGALFVVPGATLLPVSFANRSICVLRNSDFVPRIARNPYFHHFPVLRPRFLVAAET